jgi:hypothetical protein
LGLHFATIHQFSSLRTGPSVGGTLLFEV